MAESCSQAVQIFRIIWPYLLSHHPSCEAFRPDTLKLGRVPVCRGCIITYPVAVSVVLLVVAVRRTEPSLLPDLRFLIALGTVFAAPQLVRGLIVNKSGLGTGTRVLRTLVKVSLGLGIGSVAAGTHLLLTDPLLKILTFLLLYALYAGAGGLFRLWYIQRRCGLCPYGGDWQVCVGFERLKRLERQVEGTGKSRSWPLKRTGGSREDAQGSPSGTAPL